MFEVLLSIVERCKLLPMLYKILQIGEECIEKAEARWERDLSIVWTDEEWKRLKLINQKCSRNIAIQESCCKLIYRWYPTPSRLGRRYPHYQGNCWCCQCEKEDFIHIWWHCDKVRDLGEQTQVVMQSIIGKKFPCTPWVMLLGNIEDSFNDISKILLINMLAAAATLIANKWKTLEVPTLSEWLAQVRFVSLMCKLSAICGYTAGQINDIANFKAQWKLFMRSKYSGLQSVKGCEYILAIL